MTMTEERKASATAIYSLFNNFYFIFPCISSAKKLQKALKGSKKSLLFRSSFFICFGAGQQCLDNREIRENRILCPQLCNGLLSESVDGSVHLSVSAGCSHFVPLMFRHQGRQGKAAAA
jgi:hypothetical protein